MRLLKHSWHWLVPHRRNDHRPHLVRPHGLVLLVAVIFALHGMAYASRPAAAPVDQPSGGSVLAYASNITPVDLFNQTNAERAAAGLPTLKLEARLNQSAQLKAQNMLTDNYWAHVSPSGVQPWYWFGQAGYSYRYAGENLAKDFDTSSGVTQGWMNSAGHRANILSANYTEVGFAVVNGTLQGGQTTLVVAHYGAPATATTPATVAAPAVPKAPPRAAATPAPTPLPTPAITVTPAATSTPSPSPAAAGASTPTSNPPAAESAPPAKSYGLFAPLAASATLPWPTLGTLGLLGLLLLVYVATHVAVWRRNARRWHSPRYRPWAAVQVGGLTAAIIMLATSGLGHVG